MRCFRAKNALQHDKSGLSRTQVKYSKSSLMQTNIFKPIKISMVCAVTKPRRNRCAQDAPIHVFGDGQPGAAGAEKAAGNRAFHPGCRRWRWGRAGSSSPDQGLGQRNRRGDRSGMFGQVGNGVGELDPPGSGAYNRPAVFPMHGVKKVSRPRL